MKISIQQSLLSRHLDNASKFLPKKDMIPILSHIVLSTMADGLEVTAGNTDTFIKSVIPAEEYAVIQDGAIAVPGKELTEIVKKLSGLITIEIESSQSIIITSGKSEFELSALDPEEYPKFPKGNGISVTMKGSDFRELIATTSYAASTNESTPILTGVFISQENGALKLIACDRHRLTKIESENEGEDFQTVVYSKTLDELSKIIGDEEIEISFGNGMVVKSKQFTFYTRILDGSYPNTEQLIPTSFKIIALTKKQEISAALDRVYNFVREGKTNNVKLSIKQNEIEITAKESTKRAKECVDVTDFTGEEITISCNSKYMLDALKAIDSTEVEICLNETMQPFILRGKDELAVHLILPYRTI